MKKTKENAKKTILTLIAAIVAMNIGLCRTYAEEEPVQPVTEGMSVEEANELIEAYNTQVDEYNEKQMEAYLEEVAETEAYNAQEDAKVEENEKLLAAYESAQAKIESHEEKGITETRTDNPEDLPTDWVVTVEADQAKTIKVEEAENKSGKTVKVLNLHIFYDEEASDSGYIPNDISQLETNEDIQEHIALAEWETIEVDENDIVQVISEAEAMGYRSAAFYKWFEGYTNGYWMPSYSLFTSTAVHSYSDWYKGASQVASYDEGTTDRRAAVDMFSIYGYSFIRTGSEPVKVEKYEAEYKETPVAPQMLEKMDLLEEKEEEKTSVPTAAPSDPDTPKEEPVVKESKKTVEIKEEKVPQAENVNVEIDEPAVPASAPVDIVEPAIAEAKPYWALINLIMAILSVLTSIGMILTMKKNEKEDEDEEGRRNTSKLFGLVPAILSVVIFLLTEDMRSRMILADRYTLLMILIAAICLVLAYLTRNRKDEDENEQSDLIEIPAT